VLSEQFALVAPKQSSVQSPSWHLSEQVAPVSQERLHGPREHVIWHVVPALQATVHPAEVPDPALGSHALEEHGHWGVHVNAQADPMHLHVVGASASGGGAPVSAIVPVEASAIPPSAAAGAGPGAPSGPAETIDVENRES
jgi:hypothetical protein